MRPNGVLAVWSSARDEAFSRRLRQAGFSVDIVPVRAAGAARLPRRDLGRVARLMLCSARRAIRVPTIPLCRAPPSLVAIALLSVSLWFAPRGLARMQG